MMKRDLRAPWPRPTHMKCERVVYSVSKEQTMVYGTRSNSSKFFFHVTVWEHWLIDHTINEVCNTISNERHSMLFVASRENLHIIDHITSLTLNSRNLNFNISGGIRKYFKRLLSKDNFQMSSEKKCAVGSYLARLPATGRSLSIGTPAWTSWVWRPGL